MKSKPDQTCIRATKPFGNSEKIICWYSKWQLTIKILVMSSSMVNFLDANVKSKGCKYVRNTDKFLSSWIERDTQTTKVIDKKVPRYLD